MSRLNLRAHTKWLTLSNTEIRVFCLFVFIINLTIDLRIQNLEQVTISNKTLMKQIWIMIQKQEKINYYSSQNQSLYLLQSTP